MRRIGVIKRTNENYTDRWPSETNMDGKQTLNLRIDNDSRMMVSQKTDTEAM